MGYTKRDGTSSNSRVVAYQVEDPIYVRVDSEETGYGALEAPRDSEIEREKAAAHSRGCKHYFQKATHTKGCNMQQIICAILIVLALCALAFFLYELIDSYASDRGTLLYQKEGWLVVGVLVTVLPVLQMAFCLKNLRSDTPVHLSKAPEPCPNPTLISTLMAR